MIGNPPTQAQPRRRTIGPVPPRKDGKLLIRPLLEKRVRLNAAGEPVLSKEGKIVEDMVDTRHPVEYRLYESGIEKQMLDGATKGLRLFQVDFDAEPLMLVYARDEQHAAAVYQAEWGITRFGGDGNGPIVTLASEAA
jgi:hypothetical protein